MTLLFSPLKATPNKFPKQTYFNKKKPNIKIVSDCTFFLRSIVNGRETCFTVSHAPILFLHFCTQEIVSSSTRTPIKRLDLFESAGRRRRKINLARNNCLVFVGKCGVTTWQLIYAYGSHNTTHINLK